LMSAAPSIEQVTLGRALTGLGAAGWVPLVVAWSSLFPPAEAARAAATLTLANSASRMLASLLAGPVFGLGGYPLEFSLAIGAAGLGVLVLLPGGEARRPARKPSLASTGRLITRKAVLGPALLNAVLMFGNYAAVFSFIPILAKNLGASDLDQGALISLNLLAYTLGNWAASALVRRLGERSLLYLAFGGSGLGIGLAALASGLPAIYLIMAWLGVAAGIGYPILMGQSIAPVVENERNTAMGLHQAVYGLGMFGGPWLAGILANHFGLPVMFGLVAAAVSAVGMWGVWYLNQEAGPGGGNSGETKKQV
jgi:predicted MFS family arabinose efflux permease